LYIARQAIFNRTMKVVGYELLFRTGKQSKVFDGVSSLHASASVLGTLFETGISKITDDKLAFINFDAELLNSDSLELIDADRLIIEVLETVIVDEALIERVKTLKNKGYKIALDDFVESYEDYPLVPYANIIKFDLMATPLESIVNEVKKAISQRKALLAEKIETQEEFIKAKAMGFQMFQGFFFSKPDLVVESKSHTTTKSQYGRLIQELHQGEPSFQNLAEIIEKDPNLAYRLVMLNSMKSGKNLIYSIKQALAYMGLKEVERWIHILMLREMSDSKPDELIRISLVRSRFCEIIARSSNLSKIKYEASIMGLFSVIDAMLNKEMEVALHEIALTKSITEALIHGTGELSPICHLIRAYETGDWDTLKLMTEKINISETEVYDAYVDAISWANGIMVSIGS